MSRQPDLSSIPGAGASVKGDQEIRRIEARMITLLRWTIGLLLMIGLSVLAIVIRVFFFGLP